MLGNSEDVKILKKRCQLMQDTKQRHRDAVCHLIMFKVLMYNLLEMVYTVQFVRNGVHCTICSDFGALRDAAAIIGVMQVSVSPPRQLPPLIFVFLY